jgi:Ser/Thr protein kinase RdoA (MazF antagonist)
MAGPIILSHQVFGLPRLDRFIRDNNYRAGRVKRENQSIAKILDQYRLTPLSPVTPYGSQGRSDVWSVTTDRGRKFIKRYKSFVGTGQIQYEHSILLHLANVGFPAPALVQTEDGETIVENESRSFALFEFLEGYFQYHNYVYLPAQRDWFLTTAGYILGWLHSTLDGFIPAGWNLEGYPDLTGKRVRGAAWYAGELQKCRQETLQIPQDSLHPTLRDLMDLSIWMEDTLLQLDEWLEEAKPKRTIIHADYGPYNLLFKHGFPVVVVDFELARLDWRLVDLVKSIDMFTRNRFQFNLAKIKLFLESYQKAFPITREELFLLPYVWVYFILRRLIIYWVRKDAEESSLQKAQIQMDVLQWVIGHHDLLSNLGTMR